MNNVLPQLFDYAENKNKKLYQWLNCDNLGEFTVDNGVFWFVAMNSQTSIPNYIYAMLKAYGKRQGWTYLYDLPKQ